MARWSPLKLFAASLLIGCSETRTYQLSVRNELPTPVTVCLTKSDGPVEDAWVSPEEMAAPPHPASDDRPPGQVIPPGKTVTTDPVTGRFDPDYGRAFLRVYAGTPGLSAMTAVSRGSSNRVDVPLQAGLNRLVVRSDGQGKMTVADGGVKP